MTVAADALAAELARVAERLRLRPPRGRRATAAYAVVQRLAELADAPIAAPWVDEHVLGDQIAVLGRELLATTPGDAAVEEVRALLRGV